MPSDVIAVEIPDIAPTATATLAPTPTPPPTDTPLPTDTPQPTATATVVPTATETATATDTPLPTLTPTPINVGQVVYATLPPVFVAASLLCYVIVAAGVS
ncbi:MAG: hypothetical protein R2867_22110 [Caldilineaceae bacterium]